MKLFEEWISLFLNVLRLYVLNSYQIFVIVNYRVRMAYCFNSFLTGLVSGNYSTFGQVPQEKFMWLIYLSSNTQSDHWWAKSSNIIVYIIIRRMQTFTLNFCLIFCTTLIHKRSASCCRLSGLCIVLKQLRVTITHFLRLVVSSFRFCFSRIINGIVAKF